MVALFSLIIRNGLTHFNPLSSQTLAKLERGVIKIIIIGFGFLTCLYFLPTPLSVNNWIWILLCLFFFCYGGYYIDKIKRKLPNKTLKY